MGVRQQDIEASETPAVKDLRSLFEQKARESPPVPSGSSHSGNSSASLNSRKSVGRRSSPVPFDDPTELLIPVKPSSHDQNSLRKRPPPPPPSRAQKPQLGSPSPSISPLLHPAPDQGNASENRSPSPSVKQRLATRPPPPIPELRLDQNHNIDPNSERSVKVGEPLIKLTSVVSKLPPPRPVQAQPTQNPLYSDPFESDPAETLSTVPLRRDPRPPLPRRPIRSSYPPGPDGHQSETDSDSGTVSTSILGLDTSPPRRMLTPYASRQDSQQSYGSSGTTSSLSLSRTPSESDGSGPPPRIPPRPTILKSSPVTEEPLTQSPVSSLSGHLPPPLPQRRPASDNSSASPPSHVLRKSSGQMPPPAHSNPSFSPPRMPSTRRAVHSLSTPEIHRPPPPHPPLALHSYQHAILPKQFGRDSDDTDQAAVTDHYALRSRPTGLGGHGNSSSISKMPPPPTRNIALGDRLPAVRPAFSDDEDEESGDEDDQKSKLLNTMPDTSRSSRRAPILHCHGYNTVQVQSQTHSAIVCAAGHVYVAAQGHHVKVYDLSMSESPMLVLDGKDMGLKELKATSLEFCPAKAASDKGRYVWIGTKDGHMFEIDVTTGQLTGSKLSIHLYAITRILRHGDAMISLDDTGKVTILTPGAAGEDLRLASAQIRGSRISDRQEFVEILAGKLWTSAREASASGARGPAVRVYDILTPGSVTRSVLPTERIGTVTSGTTLSSHPNHVYLGHEGGFVTIWLTATDDGIPVCEEVVRVSNSDVLCLAGINDRLWVGGRNGTIAAYSVESRPWVMTNNWAAHWNGQTPLPLQKIAVDPYSIDKIGKLCVYSIGRDDHVKCWDGLLGADWQDTELLKLEKSFSDLRNITILFVSWNIGASKPEQLSGSKENSSFLYDALNSVESPDILVFGLQEVVPLDKANVAKFLKKKKGLDGASTTLHSEHRRWADKLVGAVTFALPNERYKLLYSKELVGLLSCVMVKTNEQPTIRGCAAHTISRGVRHKFGNKGAVAVRLLIDDTSLCFLNCHLAAGHRRVRNRNADAAAIIEHERLFPELETLDEAIAFVGGGDGTMALDHDIVFMSGDLNYRIDQRRDMVISSVQHNTYQSLLVHDQLTKEMKTNVRLRSFAEGPITFPPTYKYNLHSTDYDTSEKQRIPAWCDRVLWRARDPTRVEQLHYKRYEPDISDHRPITAAFRVLVKSIQHDARSSVKEEVQAHWALRERQLLDSTRAYFVEQLVL